MFDWLPIKSACRSTRGTLRGGEQMQRQIDLLSRLSDLSLPLCRSSRFHSFSSLSFKHRPLYLPCLLPVSCTEAVFERLNLPQNKSPPVRRSGESWLESARDSGSCPSRVYFFFFLNFIFQLSVSRLSSPPSFRNAAPPPLHLCLSVWLMVWNIERCLFLLWLGRQGALWQTTRDQIDYAASLFFFFFL